jgi:hypothetical protein
MSDDHVTFLLTLGFFALIGAAVLFLELIAETSQLASEHTAFVEDTMLERRITTYKVAVLVTAAASITSILG